MAQGRSSAMVVATGFLCLLLLHFHMAQAAANAVGDAAGWTFNVVGWPQYKRFRAGDTLVFSYNPGQHDVVVVNRKSYEACTTPKGAKIYTSGKDEIKLVKGLNFFICCFPGHCEAGMKLAIRAVERSCSFASDPYLVNESSIYSSENFL